MNIYIIIIIITLGSLDEHKIACCRCC